MRIPGPTIRFFILCVCLLGLASACDSPDTSSRQATPEEVATSAESTGDQPAGDDETAEPSKPEIDILLPSEVAQMNTDRRVISRSTARDFHRVKTYLQNTLVDYEVFDGERTFRAIPLRKNMPEIRVKSFGQKTSITYILPVNKVTSTESESDSKIGRNLDKLPADRLPNGSH